MSEGVGTLVGVKLRSDDGALISKLLLREEIRVDAPPPKKVSGGFNNHEPRGRSEVHVVKDVHFGDGRYATCVACDFVAGGRSDRAMSTSFTAHRDRAEKAGTA